jgi:hypothetical protein
MLLRRVPLASQEIREHVQQPACCQDVQNRMRLAVVLCPKTKYLKVSLAMVPALSSNKGLRLLSVARARRVVARLVVHGVVCQP